MGCDIHIYIEQKGNDGDWYNRDYFVPTPVTSKWTKYERVPIISYRSYALFAILANIRNYDNIPYIDKPRGLPKNLSKYVWDEWEKWEPEGHAASYFTLLELVEAQEALNYKDCEKALWPVAVHRFNELVDELKKRAAALRIIYDFEWDSPRQEVRSKVVEKASKIRIVFWFDN